MLKFMMYNGNSMFVVRMLLNTTSVTAHDAGKLLAVTKYPTIKHYYFLDRRLIFCHQNIPITWPTRNGNMDKGYFNPATMNVVIVDIEIVCSHCADKYIRTTNNSLIHWHGSILIHLNSSFKFTIIDATENIPNYTRIHLMVNLIDHLERSDFDTVTNMIENTSLNILYILSISTTNGNV